MASSRSDGPNTQTNPEWRRKQNNDKKTTRTTFVDRFLVSPSVIRGVTVVLALSPFVALTVTAVTACRERNTTAKAGNPQRTTPEEPTRLTNILSDRPFKQSLLNLKKKKKGRIQTIWTTNDALEISSSDAPNQPRNAALSRLSALCCCATPSWPPSPPPPSPWPSWPPGGRPVSRPATLAPWQPCSQTAHTHAIDTKQQGGEEGSARGDGGGSEAAGGGGGGTVVTWRCVNDG